MYLTCANQRFHVSIESNICDDQGHPTYGLFRPGIGIVIDSATPPTERRGVLVHELSHAFEHRMGRVDPEDAEGRQNRVAAIESQFAQDLSDQGGEAVIHALFGDDSSQLSTDEFSDMHYAQDEAMAEWPTQIWCPSCHEQYPSRAVRNGRAAFNPRINGFMVKRMLVCGKCGRETLWGQRCTYEGLPLPDVVVNPTTRMIPAMS